VEEDISKSTIIVLVVLTLAVSMVGTWAVLDEVSTPTQGVAGSPQGQVKLTIVDPDANTGEDSSGAQVGITIVEPSS